MNRPTFSRRFKRDLRGAVAVEFALLAPFLLVFYFAMSEMTQIMMASRRLSHATSLMGDIAAQNATITSARAEDIYMISRAVMEPFASAPLRLCLVSVTSDSAGKDTVAWSFSKNSPSDCPTKGTVVTNIPVEVLPASTSVVMSKASYTYNPTINLNINEIEFKRTFYLRPRRSAAVTWQ